MKAELKPLIGKYYGTEIEIDFEDGGEKETIILWNHDTEPSIRELERYGYSQTQWENNVEVDNGFNGKSKIKDLDLFSDGHFESKLTYERALKLVSLINSIKKMKIDELKLNGIYIIKGTNSWNQKTIHKITVKEITKETLYIHFNDNDNKIRYLKSEFEDQWKIIEILNFDL